MNDEPTDFGEVITIISDKPIKFDVKGLKLKASTADKYRNWPLAYTFTKTEAAAELNSISDFVVRVEDQVIRNHFAEKEDHPELHNSAIRFGLVTIRKKLNGNRIDFTDEKFKKLMEQARTNDAEIFGDILNFIYRINKVWPMQHISHFDILDNFFYGKEKMSEAWRYWNSADYLEYKGAFRYRINRGNASTSGFYIKPQMMSAVEIKLSEYFSPRQKDKAFRAFLSYSTKDSGLAVSVKNELERAGIDVFLAHEDIEISEDFIVVIQKELTECDVFIPILTESFEQSEWTDQESGQAWIKDKLIIPLKVDINPYGFLRNIQATTVNIDQVHIACEKVIAKIEEKLKVSFDKSVS